MEKHRLNYYDDKIKKENYMQKDINMFVQNEADAKEVKASGFKNVEVLQQDTIFEGIHVKTTVEHGR